MNEEPTETPWWERAAALHRQQASTKPVPEIHAPAGFARAVVTRWWETGRFLFWAKCCLLATLAGLALALAAHLLAEKEPPTPALPLPPTVDLPAVQ